LARVDGELLQLRRNMEVLNLKFLDLQSWGEDIGLALVEVENLQHNLDAHGLMLKSFKNLLETKNGEYSRVSTKSSKAYDTWTSFITKVDI
jgi:hypothetical protein